MKLPFSDKLRKELLRYLLIGGIAVGIDTISYTVLSNTHMTSVYWAKRISFILGAIWAFFMNKYFTFSQKDLRVSEPFTFTVVYLVGFLLNSLCHNIVYDLFHFKSLAFICATGLSTCTNFIGQKWIVFRTLAAEANPQPAPGGAVRGNGMLFKLARNSEFLQNLAASMHASVHPSIEHNLAKMGMIKKALFHCELEQIPGSYFEFGVFEGTSLMASVRIHGKLKSAFDRNFYGFDAFEGFKYFNEQDKHPFFKEGDFKSTYDRVLRRFRRFGNVRLVKGYFEDTLGGKTPAEVCGREEKCAVCFIDCDLMTPALVALDFIRPALQKGSVIILDDYWAYKGDPNAGTSGAMGRFLAANPGIRVRPYYDYGHGGASFVVWDIAGPPAKNE